MNTWRSMLNGLLAGTPAYRKPALRRSQREDALYTTDLPGLVTEEELESFRRSLRSAGWRSELHQGWLELSPLRPAMPGNGFQGPYGNEAGCCRSLLIRNGNRDPEGCEQLIYRLIKAGETGADGFEACCAELHRQWAERLRKHQRLPQISEDCFGEASGKTPEGESRGCGCGKEEGTTCC